MSVTTAPRSRMSPERLGELYSVVLELLREVGYERLTLDLVAARAHASKTTLYRQWDGKPGLVMAAMRYYRQPGIDYSAFGSLDEVFAAMSVRRGDRIPDMKLVFALLHAAAVDQEFGTAVREIVVEPEAARLCAVFERAAERGEITSEPRLFRQLAYTIIEHFVLSGTLDGQPDTAARRRAFLESVIRPALTSTAKAPG